VNRFSESVYRMLRISCLGVKPGAGTWIPANHLAAAAGIEDSAGEALAYIRAAAPEGWAETEDALWQAFVHAAPEMLRFVEANTPLRYALTPEPDPLRTLPGAKARGRMMSPLPLSRWRAGRFAFRIRRSTIPEIFTPSMLSRAVRKGCRATPAYRPFASRASRWCSTMPPASPGRRACRPMCGMP
jgi:hypothetical protein